MKRRAPPPLPNFDYGDDAIPTPAWAPSGERAASGKGRWPYPPNFWQYLSDEVRPYYKEVRAGVARANKAKRQAWAERKHYPWPATPSQLALCHAAAEFGLPMNGPRLGNIFSELHKRERENASVTSGQHFRE